MGIIGCVESGLHERIEGVNLGLQFGGILSCQNSVISF